LGFGGFRGGFRGGFGGGGFGGLGGLALLPQSGGEGGFVVHGRAKRT
jgi:hypothetical protein